MKALSLWQPWASLIAVGAKTIETRGWSTNYRGPLLIHAAKRRPDVPLFLGHLGLGYHRIKYPGHIDVGYTLADTIGVTDGHGVTKHQTWPLPLGAVVATCTLVDVVPMVTRTWPQNVTETCLSIHPPDADIERLVLWTFGVREGRNVTDQLPYGLFEPGRYAWLLADVRPLTSPVPAKGRQGLWAPDADLIAAVEAQRVATCPKHGHPWVVPDCPDGYRRCTFYLPELGASEDYGCPQNAVEAQR